MSRDKGNRELVLRAHFEVLAPYPKIGSYKTFEQESQIIFNTSLQSLGLLKFVLWRQLCQPKVKFANEKSIDIIGTTLRSPDVICSIEEPASCVLIGFIISILYKGANSAVSSSFATGIRISELLLNSFPSDYFCLKRLCNSGPQILVKACSSRFPSFAIDSKFNRNLRLASDYKLNSGTDTFTLSMVGSSMLFMSARQTNLLSGLRDELVNEMTLLLFVESVELFLWSWGRTSMKLNRFVLKFLIPYSLLVATLSFISKTTFFVPGLSTIDMSTILRSSLEQFVTNKSWNFPFCRNRCSNGIIPYIMMFYDSSFTSTLNSWLAKPNSKGKNSLCVFVSSTFPFSTHWSIIVSPSTRL